MALHHRRSTRDRHILEVDRTTAAATDSAAAADSVDGVYL